MTPPDRDAMPGSARDALDLLDLGTLPALSVDPDTETIQALNRTFVDELGLEGDIMEGVPLRRLVHPKHHGRVQAALEAFRDGATPAPTKALLQHPDTGDIRPGLWAPVTAGHGDGGSLVLLCRPYGSDPSNPWNHAGFGRIPPSPSFQ